MQQREQRVRDELEWAAARRRLALQRQVPARSERLLAEASDRLRQVRVGLTHADPARLAGKDTVASQVHTNCMLNAHKGVLCACMYMRCTHIIAD